MKCVHKIVHLFVRPPKRPGFSRIDLLVLLLLGVVALASLFLHIGSPAPTTVTSSAVSAQATRAGVPGYAMALPAIPQATHRNPPVLGALRICPVAFNVLNLPQPDKANNVKSPFGTSDVLFFFTDPSYRAWC